MNKLEIPYCPVIAVTASNSDDIERKCKNCGMDDFLLKPCSSHDFKTMIDKWIQSHK